MPLWDELLLQTSIRGEVGKPRYLPVTSNQNHCSRQDFDAKCHIMYASIPIKNMGLWSLTFLCKLWLTCMHLNAKREDAVAHLTVEKIQVQENDQLAH